VLAFDTHGPADAPGGCVVLLHGLGSSAADWEPQIAALAPHHRVIAFDLPGHGRTSKSSTSIPAMAAAVAATLATIDSRPAHVIGLSLGGCVAQALTLRSPAQVRSLVLVNTFARLTPAGPRAAVRMLVRLALLVAGPMPLVGAYVARGLFPKPEQAVVRARTADRLARTSRAAYLAAVTATARFDGRRELGRIRCPALVVAGDRDTTIPLAAKEALARGIPGARLVVVRDSGHVSNWDQPEAFNRIVLEFLTTC
jgi:pimeloyl-ACP methyl ester carboxylesterase